MTIPTLPYGTALRGQDASDWAVAILGALGAPVTTANVYSLAGWFLREGGGGQNNPMNTTLGSEYPAINSDGVRNFPTPEIGVAETVATLENGYSNVVASFRAGTGLEHPNAATAGELLKWSGHGYSYITPDVVPMPVVPPKPSYHYDWFSVGRERNAVERYDKITTVARRRAARPYMGVLKTAVWVAAHAGHPLHPAWSVKHRGWRYQQLSARAQGKVVKPS